MTRTTSRSFLDKSKAQSSETPRPDKTVCGFLFNRLPAALTIHPPLVWFPNPLAIGLFQSQMGTLSSHHGQQTTADERRIRKMWMAETVYVSTSSLLALGACALWVNKRFTDAFTSNKESACFYWTPPVNVLPILLLFRLLQYSHLFSLPWQVFYRGRQMNALSLSARRM